MIERDKQRIDQQKKQTRKSSHKKQEKQQHPQQKKAGMATDPEAMQDPGYIERMNEKTSKH